jgi:hypothetical protein
MLEIQDYDKYQLANDLLAQKKNELIKGFLQKQEEIFQEILSAHGLTMNDMALHGSRQTIGDTQTLFYKEKPIAFFTKEEIKTECNVTTISQKYKILK